MTGPRRYEIRDGAAAGLVEFAADLPERVIKVTSYPQTRNDTRTGRSTIGRPAEDAAA